MFGNIADLIFYLTIQDQNALTFPYQASRRAHDGFVNFDNFSRSFCEPVVRVVSKTHSFFR